jgi:hypothetical protein
MPHTVFFAYLITPRGRRPGYQHPSYILTVSWSKPHQVCHISHAHNGLAAWNFLQLPAHDLREYLTKGATSGSMSLARASEAPAHADANRLGIKFSNFFPHARQRPAAQPQYHNSP